MHNITEGSKNEQRILVTSENAISFLGVEGARVLSTPHMIAYMERACRELTLPALEPGYDTVGTRVNVAHVGAAPIGSSVRFSAEIIRADDRRVEFRVEAWNGEEKVGEGTHERAIVNVEKFASRLLEKQRR